MSSADQVLSRCSDVPDVIGCTERELIPALLTALLARRRTQSSNLSCTAVSKQCYTILCILVVDETVTS